MRLIDADELLKYKNDHEMISTHMIYNAPTVDAVPVIRCKDCKHFEADLDGMTMYCANEIMPTVFVCTGQGYCSEAERREDDQTD